MAEVITSRRHFLGSVACAFAAAGVACKIPAWATVDDVAEPMNVPWQWVMERIYGCDNPLRNWSGPRLERRRVNGVYEYRETFA